MKRIIIIISLALLCCSTYAQLPADYQEKTEKLADALVKSSKEGNYNKTYKALRNIQKYEFRLQKDQLVRFYSDIHESVAEACEKYGIDENGKKEMRVIVDALFSDKLKEEVNNL